MSTSEQEALAERIKRMRAWQGFEVDDFRASDLEAVLTAAEWADAHRPTEPDTEWEYATRAYGGVPDMARYREWGSCPPEIAAFRRRPAGPWLPVTPKGEADAD